MSPSPTVRPRTAVPSCDRVRVRHLVGTKPSTGRGRATAADTPPTVKDLPNGQRADGHARRGERCSVARSPRHYRPLLTLLVSMVNPGARSDLSRRTEINPGPVQIGYKAA